MNSNFTEEELQLAVDHALTNATTPSFDELLVVLFAKKVLDLSQTIREHIRKLYVTHLFDHIRFYGKQEIVAGFQQCSAEFILKFQKLIDDKRLDDIFELIGKLRDEVSYLKEHKSDALDGLWAEFLRLYKRLYKIYQPFTTETTFRQLLVEWFQSGEMTLEIHNAIDEWYADGGSLVELRKIKWPKATARDVYCRKVVQSIAHIKMDKFLEFDKLGTILDTFLRNDIIKNEGNEVVITGKTIFISEWKERIKQLLKDDITSITIYACDCCGIDASLDEDYWKGRNLQIVTNRVYIWNKGTKVVLSGHGYQSGQTKAKNAQTTSETGTNGKDGRAGESSGNMALLTNEIINPKWLTIELNGGNGEDGQHGGDGVDGTNGAAIDKDMFKKMCFEYSSLYWTATNSWDDIKLFCPPNCTLTKKGRPLTSVLWAYIYREFVDGDGRNIVLSVSAERGWTYNGYDLFVHARGTAGTSASCGGSNGVGGEGGARGSLIAQNVESGEQFSLDVSRAIGNSGVNGKLGKSGINGRNGNDMALIDRNAKEPSKFIYGGNGTQRVAVKNCLSAGQYTRLNGYRKHEQEESDCYISFTESNIDQMKCRAEKAQQRTERTKASKSVSKQSIITDRLLCQSAAIFSKENAYLANACKATTIAESGLNEEEDEDEEEAENVTEEAAVLRNREQSSTMLRNYTTESERQVHKIVNADALVHQILSSGNFPTVGACAQNLFDLFAIELDEKQLNTIVFRVLWQKIGLRRALDTELSITLLALLQAKLVNGKTYSEIIEFGKTMTQKRQRKYDYTRFRTAIATVRDEMESMEVIPNLALVKTELLFGVKQQSLDGIFDEYQDAEKIKKLVNKFLFNYERYQASCQLLIELNRVLLGMRRSFQNHLEEFKQHDEFNWVDGEQAKPYLDHLQRPILDELKREEAKAKAKGKAIDAAQESQPPKKTSEQQRFELFTETVGKDKEFYDQLLGSLSKRISNDKVLTMRFGAVPNMKSGGWKNRLSGRAVEKSKELCEASAYLIRLYWMAQVILDFNRHLYACTELFKRTDKQTLYVDIGGEPTFDRFLERMSTHELDLADGECGESMKKNGLNCASFRYLVAYELNVNICVYRKCGWQMLKKVEDFNPTAKKSVLVWEIDEGECTEVDKDEEEEEPEEEMQFKLNLENDLYNSKDAESLDIEDNDIDMADKNADNDKSDTKKDTGKEILDKEQKDVNKLKPLLFSITANKQFLTFVEAQTQVCHKYKQKLSDRLYAVLSIKRDYTKPPDQIAFASWFPKPLQKAVIEWIEAYQVIAHDQTLIALLHDRFEVDGCHLTLFELQFLLNSAGHLKTLRYCSIELLQLFICAYQQTELVNAFLYLRIEYNRGSRFGKRFGTKVYNLIDFIDGSRLKALFAVKLDQASIADDELRKVLLMLQHMNNGAGRLEKIGIDEWIDIARRQKWSEIGHLLKAYGDVGYYLGYLDSHQIKAEKALRNVLDGAKIVPEKLIARITYLIANREIAVDKEYLSSIKQMLSMVEENHSQLLADEPLPKSDKYRMLTHEKNQNELMRQLEIEDRDVMNTLFPKAERSYDDLKKLIVGLHDQGDAAHMKRSEDIARIVSIFQNPELNEHVAKLMKFDNVLFEKRKIHLRATQIMAVMCAVESEKNVLEQVNTGEGKSYIIAALAYIRSMEYKTVDIITSSPVLAQRDAAEMSDIFEKLHITVAHNCDEDVEKRKAAYQCNIVYGDIQRFQRDYLLQTFYKRNILGGRNRAAVIVDEVDNMMLDNGNNMLYLSHNVPGLNLLDSLLIYIHKQISMPIYNSTKCAADKMQQQFDSETIKRMVLTDIFGRFTIDDLKQLAFGGIAESIVEKIYEKLITIKIIDADGYLRIERADEMAEVKSELMERLAGVSLLHRIDTTLRIILRRKREIRLPSYLRDFVKLHLDEFVNNCKRALFLQSDDEYVVDIDHSGRAADFNPKVTIIDKNTGADLPTSQWSGGLHQFLQLKHGCRLAPFTLKAVFVSNVSYLKAYERINGVSGTLGSKEESKTLIDLYGADLLKIPTCKPKNFAEYVPLIATTVDEWLSNIYNEVCDQVAADRSVLIVCQSGEDVKTVNAGLSRRFETQENKSSQLRVCFDTVTIYERDFQKFDFTGNNCLKCGRLIIATNLAGRGTDIKLTEEIRAAGGLHVIVSFLPKNCRIEDQAFGRVSRSGDSGSAQIMALIDENDQTFRSGTRPSVFQLKEFRDNAEVHRLQSLKRFYDFHTEIEETCLSTFRQHCDSFLGAIYSSKNNDESLATPMQVVYFALLDKWTLWLDERAPLISQCANSCSVNEKTAIIESIKHFLAAHPIDSFESGLKWLNAPQSLLTLGLIHMCHDDGLGAADQIYNQILTKSSEFAAEAYYFKGCMRMKGFTGLRDCLSSLVQKSQEKSIAPDTQLAIEYFHKARSLFAQRLEAINEEATIVMRLVRPNAAQTTIEKCGFVEQQKCINSHYQSIIANIDWLLGTPCTPAMFECKEYDTNYAKSLFDSLDRQGVISPTLLYADNCDEWQFDAIRHKYKLSKSKLCNLFRAITDDQATETYLDRKVIDEIELSKYIKLSNRDEFWNDLIKMQCLVMNELYLIVNRNYVKPIGWLDKLVPEKELPANEKRYRVRFSTTPYRAAYKIDDVKAIVLKDSDAEVEFYELLKLGHLEYDQMAYVDLMSVQNNNLFYFNNFDCVTRDDLEDYFDVDSNAAGWILQTLIDNCVLEQQTAAVHQFVKTVKKPGTVPNKKPENVTAEVLVKKLENTMTNLVVAKPVNDNDLLEKFKHIIEALEYSTDLIDISVAMLGYYCQIDEEKAQKLHNLLVERKKLQPLMLTVYRLSNKLDCSAFPAGMRTELDDFFSDRFAYTFAMENLARSLDDSRLDPTTAKTIFLPCSPRADLLADLIKAGFALPPRICHMKLIDYDDYKSSEIVEAILCENRLKLHDQANYHMQLIPFVNFLAKQGMVVDADAKSIVDNGLKKLVTQAEIKLGWRCINWITRQISKGISCITSGLSACVAFVGKYVVTPVGNFVSPYLHKVVDKAGELADAFANTAVGKVAKAAVDFAQQAIDIAKDIGSKAVEYGGKAVDYVASSRFVQSIQEFATWVYTQMSIWVNARVESYMYYSQCRTTARKLANEQIGIVDEYVVLREFNEVMSHESQQRQSDELFKQRISEHFEQFAGELTNTLFKHVCSVRFADNNVKIPLLSANSILASSEATKKLRYELIELLRIFAADIRAQFYETLKQYVQNSEDINANMELPMHKALFRSVRSECAKWLSKVFDHPDQVFYFPMQLAIQDISTKLAELIGIDDEMVFKTEFDETANWEVDKEDMNEEVKESNTEHLTIVQWQDQLRIHLLATVKSTIYAVFIEPTVKILINYVTNARIQLTQSPDRLHLDSEDSELKRALVEFRLSTQHMKKAEFLTNEMVSALHRLWHQTKNINVLRIVIKYGYPLPIESAKLIMDAIQRMLTTYRNGVVLVLLDETREPFIYKTTESAKSKMQMRPVNGKSLFVSQSDYQALVGLGEPLREDINNAFFYEQLIHTLPNVKKEFPLGDESFRQLLLYHI